MRVVILSRSARAADSPAWGLGVDAKLVEQVLKEMAAGGHARIESVDHIDPTAFYGSPRKPRMVDLQIHLEVPCRGAMGWAKQNIVVVNPEWWPVHAWNWAFAAPSGTTGGFDAFVFKSTHARTLFPEVDDKRAHVIHWRASPQITSAAPVPAKSRIPEFLYLIGASANKLAAARALVTEWHPEWPRLLIVGTERVCDQLRGHVRAANIEFSLSLSPSECTELQTKYLYHVVTSGAEGFGHTFAEAAAVGALPLWTSIPTYNDYYGAILGDAGVVAASGSAAPVDAKYRMTPASEFSGIERAVTQLLRLEKSEDEHLRGALKHLSATRAKEFRRLWRALIHGLTRTGGDRRIPLLPPKPLAIGDLPHVAIITLTRNRPQWWGNMVHNILKCDYPPDKLSWVIADDSDGMGRVDAQVAKFQSTHPRIHVKYLSMPRRLPIGEKRNKAIAAAPTETRVFIMMDDDDHYPAGSVAGRVAWLTALGVGCVYCSTLPMYDCGRYISAVNVPPLDLAPMERVSEASMAFTREFFEERGFPGPVDVAEGEGFLVDRLARAAEIPPEGIIVSFIHGANATSRRVPESSEPNGCHYGFDDEYFTYISNCARKTSV
jgi:hypothetical protein